QIRALSQLYRFTSNVKLKNILKEIIKERINKTIDFFCGEDGAIYEASSGYWYLIYSLYNEIIYYTDSINLMKLRKRLTKSKEFLANVSYNDGFLQGSGDSYSQWLEYNLIKNSPPTLSLFSN